jgi:hypothetical protein
VDPMTLLPPAWLAWIEHWAPYALALLVLVTAAVHALLPAARAFQRWTASTTATWDDGVARKLVGALEWMAGASAAILSWVPRLTVGRPAPRPSIADRKPEGGA